MIYLTLFSRAFLQVSLVSWNVAQIAAGHFGGAFLVGSAISFVWWQNARSAGREDVRGAAAVYAFGAGCGTVAGMALSRWLH